MSFNLADISLQISKYGKDMRILYVEDEVNIRTEVQRILQFLFEYVDTAVDGRDGLKKYQENKYDIILSDVNMPKMNGIEMIRNIIHIDPSQQIIMLTAFENPEDLIEMINLGVSKFARKPIKSAQFFQQLLDVVRIQYNAKKIDEFTLKLEQKVILSTTLLEQYKDALDVATIVSKTDPQGVITYTNDAFCHISGYKTEELVGKPHQIVRSPNVPSEIYQQLWKTIKSKQVWRGILENRSKAGELYTVNATILPILNPAGDIIEYISIRQDITELKRLQLEELLKSVEKARSIQWEEVIKALPTPTVILDRDSKIVYKNDLFDIMTNCSIDDTTALETYFLKKENCICQRSLIDWKECLIDLDTHCAPKLFLNITPAPIEVQIFMRCIKANALYIASFIPENTFDILD